MMNSRNAKKPRRAPVKEPRRGASEALFDCRFGQETWTERVCAGDQKRGRGERGLSEGGERHRHRKGRLRRDPGATSAKSGVAK
jgi:hypothetical protein